MSTNDPTSTVSATVFLHGTPTVEAKKYEIKGVVDAALQKGRYITIWDESRYTPFITIHFESEVQARNFFYQLQSGLIGISVLDPNAERKYPCYDEEWDALDDEKAHAS